MWVDKSVAHVLLYGHCETALSATIGVEYMLGRLVLCNSSIPK